MTAFHVGQKVVCIDPCAGIVKGAVYTVSRVGVGPAGKGMIDLVEVDYWMKAYPAYYSTRFRPVVKRKTSIEIFTKLLNTKNVRQPA